MRRRLDRCAEQWLRECGAPAAQPGTRAASRIRPGRTLLGGAPWLIAAGCLILALAAWWPRLSVFETSATAGPTAQWRARYERERMLAAPRTGHWRWGGADGADLGDVVWDNDRQRGFLRLRGFVVNDPSRARYQVWIFDAARDERYPVDGGVFDVPAGAEEIVVPVEAALPVLRPTAFAVTVEQPAGVVVSERTKLVAFARADG